MRLRSKSMAELIQLYIYVHIYIYMYVCMYIKAGQIRIYDINSRMKRQVAAACCQLRVFALASFCFWRAARSRNKFFVYKQILGLLSPFVAICALFL